MGRRKETTIERIYREVTGRKMSPAITYPALTSIRSFAILWNLLSSIRSIFIFPHCPVWSVASEYVIF
jgi:hypothetical protein